VGWQCGGQGFESPQLHFVVSPLILVKAQVSGLVRVLAVVVGVSIVDLVGVVREWIGRIGAPVRVAVGRGPVVAEVAGTVCGGTDVVWLERLPDAAAVWGSLAAVSGRAG
jgi:hypothetical protein